jgi:acyl-coenzyme A thioesterase PaaI-like protein
MNLGEITTGLAVLTALPPDMRGIVLGLQAEYLKKSRGTLTAEANFKMPTKIDVSTSCEVKTEILDESGDPVAVVRATWLLGFKHSV